jgi:NADPH2:quinone reductase
MKAIIVRAFGGPEVLEPSEVPDPVATPGHLVVRVRAAGVNPVEAYVRSGTYARKPSLPYTPGFDGAGEVESVGEGVSGWRPGDRVFIAALGAWSGTYAERMLCTPQQVFRLPEHVSFSAGASLGVPAATAHRALFGRAAAQPGETVLVHGASGAVGISAVQIARAAGLGVIGTASSQEGRDLVAREGAEHVFDHRDSGRIAAIRELTGGRGVDVVLEMLANVNLDTDLGLLAPLGRVVVIGSRGRVEIDPRLTMAKDASILGMALWNVPAAELSGIYDRLVALMEERALRPIVGREFPLEAAATAHEAVFESGARGKVVLTT